MDNKKSGGKGMRGIFPGILVFISVFMAATGFSQTKHTLSDADYDLAKAKLERAHQGFYRLSYPEAHVRDVIMPAIRAERPAIAPHYPQRTVGQSGDALFRDWMETYPVEYDLYLRYLQKQHEKWRIASTTQ